MELILVRHGETEWSRSGQHTGHTDIPLTDVGRAQAAAVVEPLRRLLVGRPSPAVFSSPLRRARDTAEIALHGLRPEPRNELIELNYGDYEGLTTLQIRESRPDWDMWRDGCPNGETVEQVGVRTAKFVESVEGLTVPVVAFAHGHLLRILAAVAVGLPASEGRVLDLDTATISVLADARGERVIKMWNVPT